MVDRKKEDATLQTTADLPAQVSTSETGGPPLHTPASVDLGSSSAIGRRLKAYYDDVASEPVPDRFLSLLDALDAAEAGTKRPDRT